MLRLGDIALDEASLAARFLHVAFDFLGVGVFAEVGDQHVGTLAGVRDGHGPPDPRVRAGDHRNLAPELPSALVAVLAAVRDRSHLALDAGYVLLLCWLAHRALLSVASLFGGTTHSLARRPSIRGEICHLTPHIRQPMYKDPERTGQASVSAAAR